jgi:hypothetical protein
LKNTVFIIVFTILRPSLVFFGSWDSLAGIATAYGLDDWGSISGREKRFFSSSQGPD